MTDFVTRIDGEAGTFEIIVKTDNEALYRAVVSDIRAVIDWNRLKAERSEEHEYHSRV